MTLFLSIVVLVALLWLANFARVLAVGERMTAEECDWQELRQLVNRVKPDSD